MKRITSAREQGSRSYQEDRFVSLYFKEASFEAGLFAVMDGHVGGSVADFCAKKIPEIFKMKKDDDPEEKLQSLVKKLDVRTKKFQEGTTLSLALIVKKFRRIAVSVAVLGDSPVMILGKSGLLHISPEHNVRSSPGERREAENRGGIYSNGYICCRDGRGLQMSRSLGDAFMGKIISHRPVIYSVNDPSWVLVASDGLLDPGHSNTDTLLQEIKRFAFQSATAQELMSWAEKRGLEDNATAIVWSRKK